MTKKALNTAKKDVKRVVFLKSPSGRFLLPYAVGQLVDSDKISQDVLKKMIDENYCENV